MRKANIHPSRRAAHVAGDAILLGWALLWLVIAAVVRSAINAMATPAVELGRSTEELATTVEDAANNLGDVQFIGEQLAAPFGPIADALRDISEQAAEQVASVEQAALVVAIVVWLAPTLTLALIYLPRRIRRARKSAAARSYINDQADLDLFALRAMANAPMTAIAAITSDPVAAWRSADAGIIAELANLELRRVGIGVSDLVEAPRTSHSDEDSRVVKVDNGDAPHRTR